MWIWTIKHLVSAFYSQIIPVSTLSRPKQKQIGHRSFWKAWLPMMASTVKNGIDRLRNGNQRPRPGLDGSDVTTNRGNNHPQKRLLTSRALATLEPVVHSVTKENLEIAGFFASIPFLTYMYLCNNRLKVSTYCVLLWIIAQIVQEFSKLPDKMKAESTACVFFPILVHALNRISKSARKNCVQPP